MSGENLARSEDRNDRISESSPFSWAGLEWLQPRLGLSTYFTPASPTKRVFCCPQFHLTVDGENNGLRSGVDKLCRGLMRPLMTNCKVIRYTGHADMQVGFSFQPLMVNSSLINGKADTAGTKAERCPKASIRQLLPKGKQNAETND